MCGIVGYVGRRAAQDVLLAGLQRLEYRGYDSAGISVIAGEAIESVRAVGNLDNLRRAIADLDEPADASVAVATAVATTLFGRFRDLFPMRRPTPTMVLRALTDQPEHVLKHCGLSRQKAAYLNDLAEHFVSGAIPTRRLGTMDDEAVIESLVRVKGIGRWTAEMFLIFTLNRPDVLPVDDLGLRDGIRDIYQMKGRPTAKECGVVAEKWRPWRTVATWYLWRRSTKPTTAAGGSMQTRTG